MDAIASRLGPCRIVVPGLELLLSGMILHDMNSDPVDDS
jgi:hypothetical protein